ncbi:MAG: PHP domain-containing protein [bacterium]|nr:PHP domain-containing protein [bacterium]
MRYDLHCHTTASDGYYSPTEIVAQAEAAGLDGLAVTDHDTVNGIAEALAEGAKRDIHVIPGIELSIQVNNRDIHVLGYFIEHENEALIAELDEIISMRTNRAREMVNRIRDMGYPLDYDEVIKGANGGAPGRPHIARAMIKQGLAFSNEEVFDKFIGDDGPAFYPKSKMDMDRAFEMFRTYRAVPVMAHPQLSDYENILPQFLERGLQGLEVDHPKQGVHVAAKLRALCREHDLVATGGSDFHVPGIASRALGSHGVSGETIRELEARR